MLRQLKQKHPEITQFENDFEEVLLEYDRQAAAGRVGLREKWKDAMMKHSPKFNSTSP
jgi:hypothetical protein